MNAFARVANAAWLATSRPALLRFRRALAQPAAAQADVLRQFLGANHACAYARTHRCGANFSYEKFRETIPLATYDDLAPWVDRIRAGEDAVLSAGRVTHLMPTSGSTGARKLIPYTAALQREFNAAIGAWICDLAHRQPSAFHGPAYWSVTPLAGESSDPASAVPIGFADDSEYLGAVRTMLVGKIMAVPAEVRHVSSAAVFRRTVLLFLLRARSLRLISVWHPSFLALLLDTLSRHWDDLLQDIERGGASIAAALPREVRGTVERLAPLPRRAAELRHHGPAEIRAIWPELAVISCWADGSAHLPAQELRRRCPGVSIQPKGLLSTEAFVSIPYGGEHPLVVTSHFLEFLESSGQVRRAHELVRGTTYEVVVTTGGGLWRYRTGDQIEVTGFAMATPSVRFVGRGSRVSDLRGEKLSEAFVAQAMLRAFRDEREKPSFAMLAPAPAEGPAAAYALYVDRAVDATVVERLEAALRENPHYACCRHLGQLTQLRVFHIENDAYAVFTAAEQKEGMRLGDIKPVSLSLRTSWSRQFSGRWMN